LRCTNIVQRRREPATYKNIADASQPSPETSTQPRRRWLRSSASRIVNCRNPSVNCGYSGSALRSSIVLPGGDPRQRIRSPAPRGRAQVSDPSSRRKKLGPVLVVEHRALRFRCLSTVRQRALVDAAEGLNQSYRRRRSRTIDQKFRFSRWESVRNLRDITSQHAHSVPIAASSISPKA
jgi:hypothetical protein